jgi:transposase
MNRAQVLLCPEIVDDSMAEKNPGRFIDADVESLDLAALGFTPAVPQDPGRPASAPAARLKLYIYGYLHKLRSSRQLEPQTQRKVEVMGWLGKLTPEFTTIAAFRNDHAQALKHVCGELTLWCTRLDVCGRELRAIDGSKVKAVHNKERKFSEQNLTRVLQHIQEQIAMELGELDQQDTIAAQVTQPTAEGLKENILPRHSRQPRDDNRLQRLAPSGASQISLTDAESRSLKTTQGPAVCDNVQRAVEQQHKLIVAHEVTHAVTDQEQLATRARRAQDPLDTAHLAVVAARGYDAGAEVNKCLDEGMVP